MRLNNAELAKVMNRGGRSGKMPAGKRVSSRSKLETDLEAQLQRVNAPEWQVDYKFHCIREWKLDLAWPDLLFAVEVDGLRRDGKGDHQTLDGVTNDCQKAGEAMLWGWQIYRCTSAMVKNGEAAEMIMRLLSRRKTDRATEA